MNIDEKIIKVMDAIKCIDYISTSIVNAKWYRLNVDMSYRGEDPVEIVQIDYKENYQAYPQYMTLAEFMYKSVSELKDLLEI